MSSKNFSDFGLIKPLLKAVEESGYKNPTPIQEQAIPLLMNGRDLLGCAQTGTGKTAAFALPMLNHLITKSRALERGHARALVLSPTRELAAQIHKSFETYGRHAGIKTSVVYGGISQASQVKALENGVHVMVATPGRLMDLVRQRILKLNLCEILVLDEADRMLDMGFIKDVKEIVKLLPRKRQTLMFSATMPPVVHSLAASMLNNPAKVQVAKAPKQDPKIEQSVIFVERDHKRGLLVNLLRDKKHPVGKAVIFARTKQGATRLAGILRDKGIKADAIHSDKAQQVRQAILASFRSGQIKVLVATDVLARGIDIDDITHVINFELPGEAENYIHRIGRTGRAGNKGIAITLCENLEKPKLQAIEKLTGRKIAVASPPPR